MNLETQQHNHKFSKLNNISDQEIAMLPRRIDNPLISPVVNFLLTNRCNFNCDYCCNNFSHSSEDLDPLLAVSFLKDYIKFQQENNIQLKSIRQIVFSGGEPSLNHTTLFEVLRYLKKEQIECVPYITTNGFIPSELLEKLIDEMICFQISFDGLNVHRLAPTGHDVNSIITNTIRRIALSKLPLLIRATITKENVSYMSNIVEYAAHNGVEGILFSPVSLMGEALVNGVQTPSVSMYMDNYCRAREKAKSLGVKIIGDDASRHKNPRTVESAKLVMLPDGSLTMTTRFSTSKAPNSEKAIFGHYSLEKGITLYFDRIEKMVKNYLRNMDFFCETCNLRESCAGRNQDNCDLFYMEKFLKSQSSYFCAIAQQTMSKNLL